ncbi:hypothetical protein [Phytoactinopolyspora halophila]|uniref:hypothetical protein n=1 Tax=Phytoactinopolyspora halophila TaxID=1981511 RepID=UPI003CCC8E6C
MLAEAYALTRRAGANADVLVDVMPHTSADSWQLRHTLIGKVLQGDLPPCSSWGSRPRTCACSTSWPESWPHRSAADVRS